MACDTRHGHTHAAPAHPRRSARARVPIVYHVALPHTGLAPRPLLPRCSPLLPRQPRIRPSTHLPPLLPSRAAAGQPSSGDFSQQGPSGSAGSEAQPQQPQQQPSQQQQQGQEKPGPVQRLKNWFASGKLEKDKSEFFASSCHAFNPTPFHTNTSVSPFEILMWEASLAWCACLFGPVDSDKSNTLPHGTHHTAVVAHSEKAKFPMLGMLAQSCRLEWVALLPTVSSAT